MFNCVFVYEFVEQFQFVIGKVEIGFVDRGQLIDVIDGVLNFECEVGIEV